MPHPFRISVLALLAGGLLAPTKAFRSSPLAHDTTNLQSYTEYLRGGRPPVRYPFVPKGWTLDDYEARYPREAILMNAWCAPGATARNWCRAELRFSDFSVPLTANTFFSRDSLIKEHPGELPRVLFQEHFDRRVKALLETRDFDVRSLELTRYHRRDRAQSLYVAAGGVLPSFLAAVLIEHAIGGSRPFHWGRAGLMTAGFAVTFGISYALLMDAKPTLYVTRIRFSPQKPPASQPLPGEVLE